MDLFIQSLNKAGIACNMLNVYNDSKKIKCNYRLNPDGSIRWIWPSNARHADFLKFYHSEGLRPAIFSSTAKILAGLSALKLLADGSFTFYAETGSVELTDQRWAWFSGTIGPNRKAILWYQRPAGGISKFVKIPFGLKASQNIVKEVMQLNTLRRFHLQNIVFPASDLRGSGCLELEDIGGHTYRTNAISNLPFEAVKEWLISGIRIDHLNESGFVFDLDAMFDKLGTVEDERLPISILNKLRLLKSDAFNGSIIITNYSHGDFTPWNVMVKNNKLHLIDLELSQNEMPALFDVFQYVYQSNILIGNKGYKQIRNQLDELFEQPEWRELTNEYGINVNVAERLYLLYTMAYYIDLYHEQPEWHTQVQWLLSTWNEALTWHLQQKSTGNARRFLLNDLYSMLQNKPYAVLKWTHQEIETLPEGADMDICMARGDIKILKRELENHILVAGTRLKVRSFMLQMEIILVDGSTLHLDLIHTFKRKSLVILDAHALLLNAAENQFGLKVPAPVDDFAYTWQFNWLNHSNIPQRYQIVFNSADKTDKIKMNNMVRNEYNMPVKCYSELFKSTKDLQKKLRLNLQGKSENKGVKHLVHLFNYYVDSARNMFADKGFIVTFSGVDGAGKSTVIENIKQYVDKNLRKKVVVIRHRPGILPIISAWKHGKQKAEHISVQNLPRQGNNSSKISSLLRFAYYFLDYLLGQWYIQIRYVATGYVVLYDRYYFDFINDSKRSNINLSPSFTKWWYRFLLKPRLNFFLYADANLILQRKQELDGPTIKGLTKKYLSLFDDLKIHSHKALYIPIENIQLADTLGQINSNIKTIMYEDVY